MGRLDTAFGFPLPLSVNFSNMATIYNSELSKELQQGAKLQIRDKMPSELADKVVPVMETNPKLLRRAQQLGTMSRGTTTTSLTIFTPQAGKETYITGLNISNTQNAACDNVLLSIVAAQGTSQLILYKRNKETLTAQSFFDHIDFVPAIKIDNGTNVTFSGAFTAGTCQTDAAIFGYQIDNPSA